MIETIVPWNEVLEAIGYDPQGEWPSEVRAEPNGLHLIFGDHVETIQQALRGEED